MQKNVVIRLRLETATGRNILAGILKGIRDRDNCSINIDTIQKTVADGKPVVLLNDWRIRATAADP